MKQNLFRLFALCLISLVIVSSCKDDDVAPEEVLIPDITGITFVDYPDINVSLLSPGIFGNSQNLPMDAQQIKIKITKKNFKAMRVSSEGATETLIIEEDTFTLPYRSSYFFSMMSASGIRNVILLNMTKSTAADPKILTADVKIDPTGLSPLAGVIKITSDQPVKLGYRVIGQDGEDFTMQTSTFAMSQEINLWALYADYTNRVLIDIMSETGHRTTKEVLVRTQPLPATVPQPGEVRVGAGDVTKSTTKFVMFYPMRATGLTPDAPVDGYYPVSVDRFGKVRWYLLLPMDNSTVMKKLQNGHWMFSRESNFKEIDLLGNIYSEIPLEHHMHHDYVEMPNGDILYLADNTAPHNTVEDVLYVIDRTGTIKDEIDLYPILDPSRPIMPSGYDVRDWFHANSVFYEESDNSVIISGRHQSAVVKVDLATKELKWILSDPTDWNEDLQPFLLTPSGEGFERQYGQHSAILDPNDPTRLILFDNGNNRSYTNPIAPAQNYTRFVQYKIDGMNITQQFEFGKEFGSQNFAPYVGNVGFVGDSRYFICFGGIYKDDSGNPIDLLDAGGNLQNGRNSVRFIEFTKAGEVQLDISINSANTASNKGIRSYRAYPFNF